MEHEGKVKRRVTLLMKSTSGIIVIAVIFTVVLILFNYDYYKQKSFDYYKNSAKDLAKTVAYLIDGEKIKECADKLEKNEYYNETFEMLKNLQVLNEIEYLYIEQLNMDAKNVMYVMDTDPIQPYELGETVNFAETNMTKTIDELLNNPFVSETESGWLCSSLAPITNSKGEIVAAAGVDLSMNLIKQNMNQMLKNALLIATLIATIMVLLSIILIKRGIVSPIAKLSSAASCYDSGKLLDGIQSELSRLKNHTGDEIEDLTISIQKMETDIKHYVSDLTNATAANERISAELSIATNIQAAMLPRGNATFPGREDFELFATMHPAKEVGGDFYDYFLLDYDHLAFIAADVSGKGVPAALFMVIAKTLIRNQAQFGLPPEKVFGKVNMQLCENNKAGMFVTAWLGVLELSTGKVIFANAGHTRPIVSRADGTCEYVKSKAGFVLAGMEMMQFRQGEMFLQPGDTLFLYTDGVTEATNAQQELYGETRLLESIQKAQNAEPKEMVELVKESIDGFVQDAPQFDDITMLAVRYHGEGSDVFTVTKTFIAAQNELPSVLEWLEGLLEKYECPMKIQTQLDIATEEIFVNVASYAYPQGVSTVDITCHFSGTPATLEMTFTDKGVPYDPLKKKDPDITLKPEDRAAGGLGIFMVKQSMDDMRYRYENGQNILTLTKKLVLS